MDIEREIRIAISTGVVGIGFRETKKYLKKDKVKLVIYSTNSPFIDEIKKYNVPSYKFSGTNKELGNICGKPFSVSTLCIVEPGESEILRIEKGT